MAFKIHQIPRLSLHDGGQHLPHQRPFMRGKVFQQRQAFGETGQQFRLSPVRLDCGKNAQTAKTGGGDLPGGGAGHRLSHHPQKRQALPAIHIHGIRHRIRGTRQQIAHGHAGAHFPGQEAHAQIKGPGDGR